jgi:hypothetical protein
MADVLLHDLSPREMSGRDTILRFDVQFRAAAYKALEILKGYDIDCVFCDYHEDFVVRTRGPENKVKYEFYQVKTKAKLNTPWGIGDVYGLNKKKKQDFQKIASSFAGKLLLHTINFKKNCSSVILLSNIYFDDDVEGIADRFKSGNFLADHTKIFFDDFRTIFSLTSDFPDEAIADCLKKFKLIAAASCAELTGEKFLPIAKDAIFRYSEVDLSHIEATEILIKLLSLIKERSLSRISEVDELTLESHAGVKLDDLLGVLSISPAGYKILLNGGDEQTLKSLSVMQRALDAAGAPKNTIEFFCKAKILWDGWVRKNRHFLDEMAFNILVVKLHDLGRNWIGLGGNVALFMEKIKSCEKTGNSAIDNELTDELLLGGVLSEIVRSQA